MKNLRPDIIRLYY